MENQSIVIIVLAMQHSSGSSSLPKSRRNAAFFVVHLLPKAGGVPTWTWPFKAMGYVAVGGNKEMPKTSIEEEMMMQKARRSF